MSVSILTQLKRLSLVHPLNYGRTERDPMDINLITWR